MTATTSHMRRVRIRANGKAEVRYNGRTLGLFDSEAEANVLAAQVEADLRSGRKPRRTSSVDPLLADATRAHLEARKLDVGAGITADTFAQIEKEARPWLGDKWAALDADGFALAGYRLSQLQPGDVLDWYAERRAVAPVAAKKELFKLKAVLREASVRGANVHVGILAIKPGKHTARTGKAIRWDEVEHFAGCFPERLQTLPEFLAQVGLRIGEALQARREWYDARARTLFIPAWACKEGRDKLIPLLVDECDLLDAQLERIGDSPYIWPAPRGGAYRHWGFWGKVWDPAVRLAAETWEILTGSEAPFDDLRPHDLRHTAVTLSRSLRMEAELVALRIGHKDSGYLLATVYNHPHPEDLHADLIRVAGQGIKSSLAARASGSNVVPLRATEGRPSATPGALPSTPIEAVR